MSEKKAPWEIFKFGPFWYVKERRPWGLSFVKSFPSGAEAIAAFARGGR